MVIITDANGNIQSPTIPENIYQGSNLANEIVFLSPLAQNNQCSIIFRLPNGAVTQEHYMTPYTSVPSEYNLNGWVYQIPADITAYSGQVTFQIKMYGPTNSSGSTQIVASCQGTFPVLKGVVPLPSGTPSADTFAEIMAYLQAISDGSIVSKATLPYDSTFSYPIGATLFDKDTTTFYTSLQDDNLGHALTDTSWWATTTIGSMEGVEQLINDAISTHNSSATAHQDLFNSKQDKTDNSLETTSKTIVGAINELNDTAIKEITTKDIRITDLDTGIYKWTRVFPGESSVIYYNGTSGTDSILTYLNAGGVVDYIIVKKEYHSLAQTWNWWYFRGPNSQYIGGPDASLVFGVTNSTSGNYKDIKLVNPTNYYSTATDVPYSANYVNGQITAVTEIAEGKTKTYTISDVTNPAFNSTAESITLAVSGSITDTLGNVIDFADMKVGEIILVTDTGVPDRWVGSIDTTNIVFYKMETNIVDLDNYVLKTTTIAGVDLRDNITKNELLTALNVQDGANVTAITGSTAPTTSTVAGFVGQLYLDTTNNNTYQCTAITEDTSTTPSTFTYTWELMLKSSDLIIQGSAQPTNSTPADFVGQLFKFTNAYNGEEWWQCVGITESGGTKTYTWTQYINGRNIGNSYNGQIYLQKVNNQNWVLYYPVAQLPGIADRLSQGRQYSGVIDCTNLNAAVKAALTDTNHLTMTSAEQIIAQQVIGASPRGIARL